jgi:RNA polymerase sigma factor (sigma-70 family)
MPQLYPNDDGQLISGLNRGQQLALKACMRRYGRALRYFAYAIVRNKEAAEEIVSDSFVKLWEARVTFSSSEKIKAFLYIVTRNACLHFSASPKNRISFLREGVDELVHSSEDLSADMTKAQLLELLYTEIEKLPRQEGLSTQEICERLNTTPTNVYFYRSKSIKTLQVIFKDKNLIVYLSFLQLIAGS